MTCRLELDSTMELHIATLEQKSHRVPGHDEADRINSDGIGLRLAPSPEQCVPRS